MKNSPDNMDLLGKADFAIDLDGQWYHEGAIIHRKELARLFSDRALKMDEAGRYWLQTPFEKYPVQVADVPYVIVDYKLSADGLEFITNMDERVNLSAEHPLILRYSAAYNMKLPYILIRGGLYARLGRNVYYALVEKFGAHVESNGARFALGELDENVTDSQN